jgi:hypothetical protein
MKKNIKTTKTSKKRQKKCNLTPETLVLRNILCYNLSAVEMREKANAYTKLIENNFVLPKNDPTWEFIDESPEFYEDAHIEKKA